MNHPVNQPTSTGSAEEEDNLPSSRKVFLYFLLLGFINIGGPVAQITMMFNHMVEKEHWLSKERFTKIMAFCHLLPGPEALQIAIYVGYLKRRLLGATIAGCTFIVPGAVAMIGLSYLYVTYGNLPQVKDLLWILKPAVLGIIAAGIIKLGGAAIKSVFLAVLVLAAVLAMIFAGPFAAVVRGFLLNVPVIPIFAVVLSATSTFGMLVWRGIYIFLKRKMTPNG